MSKCRWVVVSIVTSMLLLLNSCGGGFGSDSDSAAQYKHLIFGTDTLDGGSQ